MQLLANNQIVSTANVIVNNDGLLDLNGKSQTIASLTINTGTASTDVSALGAKVWQNAGERRAARATVLPPWDGRPVPVAEAPGLLAGVSRLPAR